MLYLHQQNGTKLAYHHLPGDTPGILFCPGFNSDMQGNKALALEAWCREEGIQFTRFDYYGHGESDGRVEDGTIGRWRDDTLAILEEVTSGPQLIVGSSMGGWIMLLTTLARPERVAGLVGIAAAPDFTRRMREHRLDAGQLRQLEETGFCDMPNDYDEPYRISLEMLEEGDRHLLLQDEIAIDAPVRLIHGQQDEDVPWQHSLAISEKLRGDDVELQFVKSGDHRLSEPQDLERLLATVGELRRAVDRVR
ncbi:MAG: alpha/beta fold hydrolase [Haliea sp.]|jgi:pimeloyl-ACP methyl ester carboxylesterase|nr:alpha/beta fold hydrolase [Haliea sp.]